MLGLGKKFKIKWNWVYLKYPNIFLMWTFYLLKKSLTTSLVLFPVMLSNNSTSLCNINEPFRSISFVVNNHENLQGGSYEMRHIITNAVLQLWTGK